DAVEARRFRKDREEVVEHPAGDEHEPTARAAQPLERSARRLGDDASARERAVVVAGERVITHAGLDFAAGPSATRRPIGRPALIVVADRGAAAARALPRRA